VSEVRVDGYVKIPEHKWYQLLDYFTRIDEQLEVLIKQVDYTNKLLASIVAAVRGLPAPPAPAQTVQTLAPAPAPAPAPEQPAQPQLIVTLPVAPLLVKTDMITVTDEKYQELLMPFTLVLITPDSDVLIAKSPDEKGFILYAGTYMMLRGENESIYVKAVSGSANLYISYWHLVW